MPTAQRRLNPGVASRLFAEPHRFEFFQAVRLLEQLFVQYGERDPDVVARRLRFRNTLSLSFPASEIEAMQGLLTNGQSLTALDDPSLAAQLKTHGLQVVNLTPAVIGMLGVGGVLPLPYSERIAERELFHRDRAARAFLDIFNTRAVALYYAAWKKYRPGFQYERNPRKYFLPALLALTGTLRPQRRERPTAATAGQAAPGRLFDQSIAYYSALIRERPISAMALQRLLSDYFRAPLRIEQFSGAWYEVPADQQTRLGSAAAALGRGAVAGARVWQRDLRVCLWVGPLPHQRFEDFLPGGASAEALRKWLTLLTGVTLEYEVRLILRAEDVRGAALGGAGGQRLGWDAFIAGLPSPVPRADTCYEVHTLRPATSH